MPFTNNAQLPKGVQMNLSPEAQDVYREAYNQAWDEHRYAQDRYDTDDSRQVTANRVAWRAVKDRCERASNGKWVLPESAQQEESQEEQQFIPPARQSAAGAARA